MGRGEDLLHAVKLQDFAAVQKLINKSKGRLLGSTKKINVDYQDGDGFTALHHAAVLANTDLVCLLIDSHASVDIPDKKGMRALHYAAWQGKLEAVHALLHSKADCNLQAKDGRNALHLASVRGHANVCKLLLECGADPSVADKNEKTPLDIAVEIGKTEVLDLIFATDYAQALVERCNSAYTNNPDIPETSSPLHVAAKNGHVEALRCLLQNGVDINLKSASGTCLHDAVSSQNIKIVQLLLDHGVDVSVRSGLGQTALEVARKLPGGQVSKDIVKLLSESRHGLLQVCAINDFKNVYDASCLAFTKGTLITVLEQHPNGNWKGRMSYASGKSPLIGYFPASYVQPITRHHSHSHSIADSDDSGIHPYEEDGSPHSRESGGGTRTQPHKYVNLELPNNPTPVHQQPSQQSQQKFRRMSPMVNNPSYDDVIFSQQQESGGDKPITVSRSTQEMVLTRPHISNPGYEDVLIQQNSASTSPSSTLSTATTSSSSNRSSIHLRHHTNDNSNKRPATAGSAHHSPPGDNKTTMPSSSSSIGKSKSEVYKWLSGFSMERYAAHFVQHGYDDLATVALAQPSDLTAIEISKPVHRKKISNHIATLKKERPRNGGFERAPLTVREWLEWVGLADEYHAVFLRCRVDSVAQVADTTWEDLQEMGITKLGHQKKLIHSIEKLAPLVRNRNRSSPPHAAVSATTPAPHDVAAPMNEPVAAFQLKPTAARKPAMSSFSDAGVSAELQLALTRRQKIIDHAPSGEKRSDSQSGSNPRPSAPVTPNHHPAPRFDFQQRLVVVSQQTESAKIRPPVLAFPPPPTTDPHQPPHGNGARHPAPVSPHANCGARLPAVMGAPRPAHQQFRFPAAAPSVQQQRPRQPTSLQFSPRPASPMTSSPSPVTSSSSTGASVKRTHSKRHGPPPAPPQRTSSVYPNSPTTPLAPNHSSVQGSSTAQTTTAVVAQSTVVVAQPTVAKPAPSPSDVTAPPPSTDDKSSTGEPRATANFPPSVKLPSETANHRPAQPHPVVAARKPDISPPVFAVAEHQPKPAIKSVAKPPPVAANKPTVAKKPPVTKKPPLIVAKPTKPPAPANGILPHASKPAPAAPKALSLRPFAIPTPSKPAILPPPAHLSKSPVSPPMTPRFDLSVLDDIDNATTNNDWPAPPPTFLTDLPPPPMPTFIDDAAVTDKFPPPLRRQSSSDESRTCFEDDDLDTGTVKRRPPSLGQDRGGGAESAGSERAGSRPTSLSLPDVPSAEVASVGSRPPSAREPEVAISIDDDITERILAGETNRNNLLDDIGSMFDDLAAQFDDILA